MADPAPTVAVNKVIPDENFQTTVPAVVSGLPERVALTLLMSMPAAAQQYSAENADQGPVDLLATIQDNASNDSDEITYGVTDNSSAAVITSIDDAVNSVTELGPRSSGHQRADAARRHGANGHRRHGRHGHRR